MPSYLAEIVDAHRSAHRCEARRLEALVTEARSLGPTRGFRAALATASRHGLRVIAEVKRRSPSKGPLAPELDPASVARAYEEGGAACLSVLTDADYFGGSTVDLVSAKGAVSIPVLRKDFTVSAHDVCDARLMGADAVLLIVAALDDRELADFAALAGELGLDVLIEVHDRAELERALATGTGLVGVNQRNLDTFEVDPQKAEELGALIPDDVIAVAESGIAGPHDAKRLADAGYQAVLVGESLVRSGDRTSAVRALNGLSVGKRDRASASRAR